MFPVQVDYIPCGSWYMDIIHLIACFTFFLYPFPCPSFLILLPFTKNLSSFSHNLSFILFFVFTYGFGFSYVCLINYLNILILSCFYFPTKVPSVSFFRKEYHLCPERPYRSSQLLSSLEGPLPLS